MVLPFDPDHRLIHSDFNLALAEKEIFQLYNKRVSIWDKAKTLVRFGVNPDVNGVEETVWDIGGIETYATGNTIDTISSTNVTDTEIIRVEGHTVIGTGVDAKFTFVVQNVTLNGQNKVLLPIPVARVSYMENVNSFSLVGDVFVYEDTAIVAGAPTDLTKAHCKIRGTAGIDQSQKCSTTFSDTDFFIVNFASAGLEAGTGVDVAADVQFEVREPGGVFKHRKVFSSVKGSSLTQINPYIIVPRNSDVRINCATTSNNVAVTASFSGYLATVVT